MAIVIVAPALAQGTRGYGASVRSWHTPALDCTAPTDDRGRTELVLALINTQERVALSAIGPQGGWAAHELDRAAYALREPSSGNEYPSSRACSTRLPDPDALQRPGDPGHLRLPHAGGARPRLEPRARPRDGHHRSRHERRRRRQVRARHGLHGRGCLPDERVRPRRRARQELLLGRRERARSAKSRARDSSPMSRRAPTARQARAGSAGSVPWRLERTSERCSAGA